MKTITCALLALCLVACGKAVETRSSDAPERHSSLNREAEFELTTEQFASAFNAASRAYGQSFKINKVEVQHGPVHDYFQQTFPSGISLTAAISKDSGHITSVTALVAENSAAAENRSNVLAISEVVAAAVNPRLSQSKSAELVQSMLQEVGSSQDAGKFPQRFINNVRYVLRSGSGIGYWWIANPV
ncbi:hypothetical protein [Herminiimonas contaminans]|uniref:Lipoprotein n=1 Tax=Herminiimonas contaminans TaxID=1111140 RepID=A0ABS0ETW6_9BURK|nr:hypothetical protein [Herminiimonas contaminans]MBF8178189.1 hypothetical protein [Herminiimonas contaminans]